jgi:hypothetical protein
VGNNISVYSDRADCLTDLRTHCVDPSAIKRSLEDRKGGLWESSYQWIRKDSDFLRWRDVNDHQSRLLWIRGDAGKGKTMLLCGIINDLKTSTPGSYDTVAYFFCEATNSKLSSATAVLKGLLFSLLSRPQYKPVRDHLEEAHRHAGVKLFDDSDPGNFYVLSEVLERIVQDEGFPPTSILVDGLDECNEGRPELLRFISRMASQSARARWLLSSRNWPDIEDNLHLGGYGRPLRLELNSEHVTTAIFRYIEHKVSGLVRVQGDTSLQKEIIDQLRRKSDGTFLWVALVLQQLKSCRLKTELRPTIDMMPSGLFQLYDRMLGKLIDEEKYTAICRCVLSTAALTNRPLSLAELQTLTGVDKEDSIDTVVNLCASFLTIREDQVYLIHQSAKDYLVGPRALGTIFPHGLAEAHHSIFSRSLEFMSSKLRRDINGLRRMDCSITEVQTPQPDTLAPGRYSCSNWIEHLIESRPYKPEDDRVFAFLQNHFLHWLESLALLETFSEGVLQLRRLEREVRVRRRTLVPSISFLPLTCIPVPHRPPPVTCWLFD